MKARVAYAAAARGVHAREMEEKPTLEKVLHAIDVFYKNADPQANRDEMAEAHTWLMKLQTSVSGQGWRVVCGSPPERPQSPFIPRRSTPGRSQINFCG